MTMYSSATALHPREPSMEGILPPLASFVGPVRSSSYQGQLEGQMEAEAKEAEQRMKDMNLRAIENRNFDWTNDNNQQFHQNYVSNCSNWPAIVPTDGQPALQNPEGVTDPGYPYGVNDSHWDYLRTPNNELLLTNTGISSNMDGQPCGVPCTPTNVDVSPKRATGGALPNRRCRGRRGGRQREKTPPFESEDERRQWEKERRKKDIHNKIEQRRRYNINDRIDDLGMLLRKGGHDIRHNKGAILRETIVYIRDLRAYLGRMEKMEEQAEELNRTNEIILGRIQRMQSFLKSRGLPSSVDPLRTGSTPIDPQWPQHWTSQDQLPAYPKMEDTQGANAVFSPYPEVSVVKQESSGTLQSYAPGGVAVGGAGGGGGGGGRGGGGGALPLVCEAPSTDYYQIHSQYQL